MSIEWLLKSNSQQTQNQYDLMLDNDIFIPDDIEYEIIINTEVDYSENDKKPELYLGDVEINLISVLNKNGIKSFSSKVRNYFFDNAHFLNYFGESELVLVVYSNGEKFEYTKVINVTLKKTKATMASDMLNYLSKNIDDISQICFSKTRSGFKSSEDDNNNMVKLENLNNALRYLESHVEHFARKKKARIVSKLEIHSEKPPVYDHNTTMWLLNNFDKLEVSKKQDHDVVINRKNFKVQLPRTSNYPCTNENENQVIHWFLMASIHYCIEIRKSLKSQEKKNPSSFENREYIRFDQVIKNSLNPIIKRKGQQVDDISKRLIKIKKIFDIIIPIKKLKPKFPIQTSYSLKNIHYATAFNLFKSFYDQNSAVRSDELNILLGMRNLSQIYEFCCLYKLINGIKKSCHEFGGLISRRLITHNKTWEGKQTMEVNVLANQFIFSFDDNRQVTLYYEKPFYVVDTLNPQNNTIVRISKSTQPYRPDFTIRVDNKETGKSHYIILDAKFMSLVNVRSKYKEMHSKYAQELKAINNNKIDNSAIRYVGLLFGLNESHEFLEDSFISPEHKPNGLLPILPYFSSFHMGAQENGTARYIVDNYML